MFAKNRKFIFLISVNCSIINMADKLEYVFMQFQSNLIGDITKSYYYICIPKK